MNKEKMDQILFELCNQGLMSPGTKAYTKAKEQIIQMAVADAYHQAMAPLPEAPKPKATPKRTTKPKATPKKATEKTD